MSNINNFFLHYFHNLNFPKKFTCPSGKLRKEFTKALCLVPRPHYYAQPMRFGSRGPRKFLRPKQTRRSETFCLTWGGAFGSGRAVNNFSALTTAAMESTGDKELNRAFLFYARFHC